MSFLSSSMELFTSRMNIFLDTPAPQLRLSTPAAPTSGSALREVGLLAGTQIVTDTGWCPIERVLADDHVLTFDNGMQAVAENRALVIRRAEIPDHKAFTMFIPRGVLGNHANMNILPMQEVVLESDIAEGVLGNAFVLTPCILLEGYQGITRHPIMTDISLHMLTFKTEQIVQANGDVLMLAQSESCFSPFSETIICDRSIYPRLTNEQLVRLIDTEKGLATIRATNAAREDIGTYAALAPFTE